MAAQHEILCPHCGLPVVLKISRSKQLVAEKGKPADPPEPISTPTPKDKDFFEEILEEDGE